MRLVSILCGLCLLAVGAFGAGMWATHKNWLPWQTAYVWKTVAKSVVETGMVLREGSYMRRRSGVEDQEYLVNLPDRVSEGHLFAVNLVLPDDRFEARLFGTDGQILHQWKLDYSLVQADGNPGDLVHAAQLMPDGSVIVTFDEAHGLARFDACGDLMWARDDRTYHHSLHADEKGGFWTWGSLVWQGSHDQKMVRFDAESGEILEEIDMIDDVMAGNLQAELALTFPENFKFDREAPEKTKTDFLHPNDVEPLTSAMADAFPMFDAGDLLVSLRNINAVAVIDRDTHKLKWIRYGPWRDQHDADFQPDGTITVFSNNRERGRSTLVKVNPTTDEVQVVFPGGHLRWRSYIMGKHQRLQNGNWLIVSAMQGRLIEATPDGQIVRELNNVVDDTFNAVLSYGEVIPLDYFDELPSCND